MIEKRIKTKQFSFLDSALATAAFVCLQLFFSVILDIIPDALRRNFFVAFFCSFFVEFVFFLAALIVSLGRKVEFFRATKLNKKIDPLTVLVAIAISLICLYGFTGLTNSFVQFLTNLGYKQMVSNITIPNIETYLLYVFLICICPAVFEETLFRGCILNGLREKFSTHASVWIAATIFMLMHGGPDQTIHQLIIGAICGYAMVYSGSIWTSIVIHFVNNFTAITLAFVSGATAADAEAAAMAKVSWGSLVLNFLLALVMAAVAGYLVWLCLKALKNLREKRERKPGELSAVATIDGAPVEVKITTPETQVEVKVVTEGGVEAQINVEKSPQKSKILTTILYTLSITYLVLDWILTLISGFVS